MNTTLNKIRSHNPCADGWSKLLLSLNKTKADDEPLSLITIFDSNGLDDALWCLRAVAGYEKEMRLYAVWCARQVQHLMTDKRSIDALEVAERFANNCATEEELSAASATARDASKAAARAATRASAWAATRVVADAADASWAAWAAWAAVSATTWDAAANAAWTVAGVARDAARDAARQKQSDKFREMFGGEK